MWIVVSKSHVERVLGESTKCVTIIAVLGKIAHFDVKENVPLCEQLNPEVFIDHVVLLQSVLVYFS